MSESKHTPGPWQWSGITSVATNKGFYCVGTEDGELICRTSERSSADARLIAAAPDLLAQCEAFAELLEGELQDQFMHCPEFETLDFADFLLLAASGKYDSIQLDDDENGYIRELIDRYSAVCAAIAKAKGAAS